VRRLLHIMEQRMAITHIHCAPMARTVEAAFLLISCCSVLLPLLRVHVMHAFSGVQLVRLVCDLIVLVVLHSARRPAEVVNVLKWCKT